jgi:putative redox protein
MDKTKANNSGSHHLVSAVLEQKDGYTTSMNLGKHKLLADEPEHLGGKNKGPSPYQLLSSALASCTAITIQMYAKRKDWELFNVEVHVSHKKDHCTDCEKIEDESSKIDVFQREIYLIGNLDEKQKKRLLQIANKCPVHKTLHSDIEVVTKLRD